MKKFWYFVRCKLLMYIIFRFSGENKIKRDDVIEERKAIIIVHCILFARRIFYQLGLES